MLEAIPAKRVHHKGVTDFSQNLCVFICHVLQILRRIPLPVHARVSFLFYFLRANVSRTHLCKFARKMIGVMYDREVWVFRLYLIAVRFRVIEKRLAIKFNFHVSLLMDFNFHLPCDKNVKGTFLNSLT